ncbi:hypothetical protein T07_9363 [Trichinella nelsoni]|uniref:Uncharacterized protein n=1 Tax=Trichinella nelsoni TaxID=6336 RepID=A0A0V0REV8_9BILA|nr:hypothetical protein T07_9363 [Trichinella nelsoni]
MVHLFDLRGKEQHRQTFFVSILALIWSMKKRKNENVDHTRQIEDDTKQAVSTEVMKLKENTTLR